MGSTFFKQKEVLVAQPCLTLCHPMDCVPYQAPLSMGFSRQEYWSELPFSPPGDLPAPGMEAVPPALTDGFFTTAPPGKPMSMGTNAYFCMSLNLCVAQ